VAEEGVASDVFTRSASPAKVTENSLKIIDAVRIGNRACRAFLGSEFSRDTTTAGANRGGSGNLHRGDKWNFCLTSA
jgi:hypothetical protein